MQMREYMGECVCFINGHCTEKMTKEIINYCEKQECYGVQLVLSGIDNDYSILIKALTMKKVFVSIIHAKKSEVQCFKNFTKKLCAERTIISVDSFYVLKDCFSQAFIGAEQWGEHCGGLVGLDAGIFTVPNAVKLLPQIYEIVDEILKYKPRNNLEKLLLVDLWFQQNIQYIKGRESKAGKYTYICEDCEKDSVIQNVFRDHYGRCEDIAFSVAMILNHPRIGVPCRQIISGTHSWNIVNLNGKEFLLDVTHNITRNPHRIPQTLMATQYSCEFTLIGKNTVPDKYSTETMFDTSHFSDNDFSRELLRETIDKLVYKGIFSTKWQATPVMKSYVIEK